MWVICTAKRESEHFLNKKCKLFPLRAVIILIRKKMGLTAVPITKKHCDLAILT